MLSGPSEASRDELIIKHWIRDQTKEELTVYFKANDLYMKSFKKTSCVAAAVEDNRHNSLLEKMEQDPKYLENKTECVVLSLKLKELVVAKRKMLLRINILKDEGKFVEAKALLLEKKTGLDTETRETQAAKNVLMRHVRIVNGAKGTLKERIKETTKSRQYGFDDLKEAVQNARYAVKVKAKKLCIENECKVFDLFDFNTKCVQGYKKYANPRNATA